MQQEHSPRKTSPGELREVLGKSKECLVIDVREYAEFETERLPDTTHAPLSRFDEHSSNLNRDCKIYVLCKTGNRAMKAAQKLEALGHKEICVVEGGLDAWKEAGYEVEKGTRNVWNLERQVRFTAGLLMLIGLVLGVTINSWWLLLSGFIGTGLVFSAVTDTCTMAMCLTKLPWNQSTD